VSSFFILMRYCHQILLGHIDELCSRRQYLRRLSLRINNFEPAVHISAQAVYSKTDFNFARS
ncbi:hypothetical protein, partial [Pseudoalteromonas rubra]|uniref:hypothetical protein n=1 Tax=Pseudoalteromonas rubra TaxID=43658 RepID=UPI001A7EFA25